MNPGMIQIAIKTGARSNVVKPEPIHGPVANR
jgi:hypothetical protein